MDEYDLVPSFSIKRLDGTFTHVFKSKINPEVSRIVIADEIVDWTPYFQKAMDSGALKGK